MDQQIANWHISRRSANQKIYTCWLVLCGTYLRTAHLFVVLILRQDVVFTVLLWETITVWDKAGTAAKNRHKRMSTHVYKVQKQQKIGRNIVLKWQTLKISKQRKLLIPYEPTSRIGCKNDPTFLIGCKDDPTSLIGCMDDPTSLTGCTAGPTILSWCSRWRRRATQSAGLLHPATAAAAAAKGKKKRSRLAAQRQHPTVGPSAAAAVECQAQVAVADPWVGHPSGGSRGCYYRRWRQRCWKAEMPAASDRRGTKR